MRAVLSLTKRLPSRQHLHRRHPQLLQLLEHQLPLPWRYLLRQLRLLLLLLLLCQSEHAY